MGDQPSNPLTDKLPVGPWYYQGGIWIFVPDAVEHRHLHGAVNYLLRQIAVRDQADQGGT